MSHLHTPRICIFGIFEAGGVTANNVLAARDDVNDPQKFDPSRNKWHNNNSASNRFEIVQDSARVASAWDADGKVADDPILGAIVSGDGVMADLDAEQRRVTDLFGFELRIKLAPDQRPLLTGTLQPTQLRDFWNLPDAEQDQPVFLVSTAWQSVLTELKWSPDFGRSRVLCQLRDVSGGALSFRIMMTHFAGRGRFLLAIGPHDNREPIQIAPGRRLTSPDGVDPFVGFPTASFLLDDRRRKLVVDLGNLFPRTPDARRMLTDLTVSVDGAVIGSPRDLTVNEWLATAGLVEWDLTHEEQARLTSRPLRLDFTQYPEHETPKLSVLNEHAQGKYVDVDQRSLRLNPGETGTVAVYARQFGKPMAGESFQFNLYKQAAISPLLSLGFKADQPSAPYSPVDPYAPINSMPPDVFDPPPPYTVTTDANGYAELKLKVKAGPFTFPPERKAINSQLYFLGDPGGWQLWGALGPQVGAGCALSVLVFNQTALPAAPKWADVALILARYARLYPFMTQVIDLSNQNAVRANASHIRERLTVDVNSVRHMPVTRDLSASDRDLIVRFLDSVIPPS